MHKIAAKNIFLALFSLLASFCVARAEPNNLFNGSTIERIRETRILRIGYGSTPPFSYKASDGTIIGYSIDLCKAMAAEIKEQLGLPELALEYVHRSPSNRIQLLNEGGMDIECNASTNSAERRRAAAFAPTHFISQTRLVSLARNNIRQLEDLRGKSVGVVLGTVNVSQILQLSRERKLGLVSVPVSEIKEAFELVKNGRVSAFAMDDVLLRNLVIQTGAPTDYVISPEMIAEPEPYGFMTRINDPQFAQLVATSLRKIYRSPQMQEIYDRWFMQPFGGSSYSLNLPMSDELKAALAAE